MKERIFRQSGVSMVEIMVALLLSLVLALGVSQIFLSSRQSYLLQEAQSHLQENGRYALEILANDMREIGYKGCSALPAYRNEPGFINVIASAPPVSDLTYLPLGPSVTGYEGSNGGWLPVTAGTPGWPGVPNATIPNTDVINIQFSHPCGGQLRAKVFPGSSNSISIAANNTCNIRPSTCPGEGKCTGDVLVLADCGHIEVFRADTAKPEKLPTELTFGTATNTNGWFVFSHDVDSEIMIYNSHTYFIRLFNGEPSLYRQANSNGAEPQPLVEGIEDLQILYGVDTDPTPNGSVDQYITAGDNYFAANPANWSRVIAVHIDLLLRTSGDEGRQLSAVTLNPCTGAQLTNDQKADRRMRKCFSSTINLRNPAGG